MELLELRRIDPMDAAVLDLVSPPPPCMLLPLGGPIMYPMTSPDVRISPHKIPATKVIHQN